MKNQSRQTIPGGYEIDDVELCDVFQATVTDFRCSNVLTIVAVDDVQAIELAEKTVFADAFDYELVGVTAASGARAYCVHRVDQLPSSVRIELRPLKAIGLVPIHRDRSRRSRV